MPRTARPAWKTLKVGDRVRLTEFPPEFLRPGFRILPATVRVYRKLLKRRQPLQIRWIERGQPWAVVRLRRPSGGWEEHSLALNHDGLIKVQPRRLAHTQTVSYTELKPGDWIRLVAIPPVYLRPGYCFHRDTRALHERLIHLRRPVKVTSVDDFGYPWISYPHRDARGRMHFHGLVIGAEDLFVRVNRPHSTNSSSSHP